MQKVLQKNASSVMNQLNLKQGLIATFKECTAMNKNERTHELVKRREKAPGAAEK
jgi:hypothetical protein